jgi:hypothetical protein
MVLAERLWVMFQFIQYDFVGSLLIKKYSSVA